MIGKIIREARKNRGWTLDQLGDVIGLTKGTLSSYETGQVVPPIETLCKIADALNDISILVSHCQSCPVRKHIFLKQFPDLNNIRRDPAIIAARVRKEMSEAMDALDRLAERYSDADYKSRPDYMEAFMRDMEQIEDVERGIEIFKWELVISSIHSSGDLQKVKDNQQAKCIANGHHKPEAQAA